MIVTVIGVGLIGGSLAIDLRKTGFATECIGVDANEQHAQQALQLGLVDQVLPMEEAVKKADLVVVAIPVDRARQLIPVVLGLIAKHTVVVDMGSTKAGICERVKHHEKRGNFVASHPIAGTENNGPEAALSGLFNNKTTIICNKEESHLQALETVQQLYEKLGMHIRYMEASAHDLHIAYVSHLSHITSFTLGLTVLNIEQNEQRIFDMAGSGFASTVRLAKSAPTMWAPIFEQNAEHLSEALEAYIEILQRFKQLIGMGDKARLLALMNDANDIRRILDGIQLKSNNFNLETRVA